MVHVQKQTKWLETTDCRDLQQACVHARKCRRPLNTLVTFAPYPGSLPSPKARSIDLNRLTTYLRIWLRRHAHLGLYEVHVWHSDKTGRNPHVHVFLHCPKPHRDGLREALDRVYPEPGLIDVCEGSDIRKQHYSGYWGSTLDYLMRFQSQRAWWGGGKRTWRASKRDEDGKMRGIPSPLVGKRWGCSRNLSQRAIAAYWKAQNRLKAA